MIRPVHGLRALVAQFIEDPDTRGGRVYRHYGRRMMRHLAAGCALCRRADTTRARVRRMHSTYRAKAGRRG